MQQVTVSGARWQQDSDGAWLCLRVSSPQSAMAVCDALRPEREYTAKITRKGRSLDANAYYWALVNRLADHYSLPPDEIYREQIRMIGGAYDVVCVKASAADKLCREWAHNGIGWMADQFPSKLGGMINVRLWYGSSTYDTRQMSQLIEQVVADCKAAGIDTLSEREQSLLLDQWGGR